MENLGQLVPTKQFVLSNIERMQSQLIRISNTINGVLEFTYNERIMLGQCIQVCHEDLNTMTALANRIGELGTDAYLEMIDEKWDHFSSVIDIIGESVESASMRNGVGHPPLRF
ncbi:unnamed protein product [Caenorhabditis angaria]|uniref:Uncharacterized protein n=1 Tax=Caenorhabditis angaria TaxID=860376 RepID=A0A9P1J2V9_9PELO|nr:unnamed protein product [Caenorhabditis angaria]